MKILMSWWLSVLAIGAAIFYAFWIGAAQRVFLDDTTNITYAIAAVGLAMSAYLGASASRYVPGRTAQMMAAFRAAADAQNICMMLGLLGTALGAIALYKTKLVLGSGDAMGAATMLSSMLGGLGAIFGCTAVSGASTIAIMIQAFVLKRAIGQ